MNEVGLVPGSFWILCVCRVRHGREDDSWGEETKLPCSRSGPVNPSVYVCAKRFRVVCLVSGCRLLTE